MRHQSPDAVAVGKACAAEADDSAKAAATASPAGCGDTFTDRSPAALRGRRGQAYAGFVALFNRAAYFERSFDTLGAIIT